MRQSTKKQIALLKRRINYFHAKHGDAFDAPTTNNIQSYNDYRKASAQLKRSQELVKFERLKNRVEKAYIDNYQKPPTIRGKKTLEKAKRQINTLKKSVNNESNFNQELDKYIDRVQAYNKQLTMKQNALRIRYLPRNKKDLDKFNRILDLAENKKLTELVKAVKPKKGETINEATFRMDILNANKTKSFTYRDRIFLRTSIKEASKINNNELADLFRRGGESLVKELVKLGFGLVEYSDSFNSRDVEDYNGVVKAKLFSLMPRLSTKSQQLIRSIFKI